MIWDNIGQVTIVALGFTFLFTAFNTCQNFASKVLKDDQFDNLGNTCLAVLYLTFAFSAFFSKAIIMKIGKLKATLFLGAMCYTFWIVCFILPSYYQKYNTEHGGMDGAPGILNRSLIQFLLIFTAAINGFGAGILWVSQGKFISICACEENQSFINAYFWIFFMMSQIIGNVIGAVVLQKGGNQSTLFIIFAIMAVFGSSIMLCLSQPKPKKNKVTSSGGVQRMTDEPRNTKTSAENAIPSDDEEEEEEVDSIRDIKETFALMFNPRMVLMMPIIIWSAFSIAIFGSIFINLMTRTMKNQNDFYGEDLANASKDTQNSYALFTMALLGLGEIFGGQVVGLVKDKIGKRTALILQILLTVAAFAVVFLVNEQDKYDIMCFVMTFVWGFMDSGLNAIIRSMLGFEFDSKIVPFAVFNFLQSLFIFAAQLIEAQVTKSDGVSAEDQISTLRLYLIIIGAIALLSYVIMLFFKYKDSEEDSDDESGMGDVSKYKTVKQVD